MKKNKAKIKERIIAINTELIALGMDEVEIFNFWDDCYKKAKSNNSKKVKI